MTDTHSHELRILLIGCGGIAAAHLEAFESHSRHLRVTACSDPSVPAREALVARMSAYGPVRAFGDHPTALKEMRGEIDAVLVLTPHHLHYEAVKDSMLAGLPVLVEKPATISLTEAEELASLSNETGLPLMVGQTRRFDPRNVFLRAWLKEDPKRFGTLRTFEMCGWQNIEAWIATKPDRNADFWILDKERAGGGVVISLLVHAIDLVRFLFDEDFTEVAARGRMDAPFKNGAESSCCALLTTRGGAHGTLHANYLARKTPYCESVKFFGDQGCIGDMPVKLGEYAGPAYYGTTGGKEADGWEFQFSGVKTVPQTIPTGLTSNAFTNQLLAFAQTVKQGKPSGSSIQDNLNTLATVEALYKSMAEGGGFVPVKHVNGK